MLLLITLSVHVFREVSSQYPLSLSLPLSVPQRFSSVCSPCAAWPKRASLAVAAAHLAPAGHLEAEAVAVGPPAAVVAAMAVVATVVDMAAAAVAP